MGVSPFKGFNRILPRETAIYGVSGFGAVSKPFSHQIFYASSVDDRNPLRLNTYPGAAKCFQSKQPTLGIPDSPRLPLLLMFELPSYVFFGCLFFEKLSECAAVQ